MTTLLLLLLAHTCPRSGRPFSWKVAVGCLSKTRAMLIITPITPFVILAGPGLSNPPNSPTQTRTRSKSIKREANVCSLSAPLPTTPVQTPKKRFTFPSVGRYPEEPEKPCDGEVRRPRRPAFWGSKRVRTVVKVLTMIFRLKNLTGSNQRPPK
jgi:hypothetical protein